MKIYITFITAKISANKITFKSFLECLLFCKDKNNFSFNYLSHFCTVL